jgi:hypothetical protein
MSGSIALALGGLVAGAVNVAGQFEALQSKLVTVFGSSELAARSFQKAVEFAASTPFDVQSIVAATVTIEAFGQSSERVLPLAANLAAAFGRSMSDVSVILGKAFSGGLEGFESLRNSFGISNSLLAKYGAELTKTGSVAIGTGAQLDKARTAIERIVNLKFGDATARQSQTLFGALSNVGDAASTLAASFGKSLIPAATAGAKAISGLLGAVSSIPDFMKAGIAGGAVLVAGLAGIGAAVAGTFAALLTLAGGLSSMAAAFPVAAAGLGVVTGAINGLTTAALGAQAGLATLAANPLTLPLLAVASIAGLAAGAIAGYEDRMRKAGDAVTASANDFRAANTSLRDGINILNQAAGATGKQVALVGDSATQILQLKAAFAAASPEAFALAMDRAGATTEDFKTKLQSTEGKLKSQKDLVANLQAEIEKLGRVDPGLQAKTGIPPENLRRIEELKEQLRQLLFILGQTEAAKNFFQGAIDKAGELAAKLQPLIDSSRSLSVVLDLSKSVGTATALNSALADVNAQIAKNAQTAEVGSASLDALLVKFKGLGEGPNTQLQREAILAQIKLLQDRGNIVDTLDKQQADLQNAAEKREELAFRRRQVLSQAQVHDELAFVQQKLANATAGSEAEVALRERERDLKKQILDREVADAKAAHTAILEAATSAADLMLEAADEANKLAGTNMEALNKVTQGQLADAVTNSQKLAVVEAGIMAIQTARHKGLIDEAAAKDQIAALTREQHGIERSISQEQMARAQNMAGLEMSALQQHLELLNAQKAAYGETAEIKDQINKTEQQILDSKLQAIDRQMQADLAANMSQEDAARKRELAVTALKEQETIKRIGLEAAQTKSVQAETTKQVGIKTAAQQTFQRLGGASSPLQSLQELSARSAFLPNFSLDSSPQAGRAFPRSLGPPQQQLARIQQTVGKDMGQAEGGRYTADINRADRAQRGTPAGDSTTNNYYLTVSGGKVKPEDEPVIRRFIDNYVADDRHRKGA